ncbi:uncharacterized protein N7487_002944 [Penicillium crustosum]|uniref:uncharacterized protein n=1 Tax=Penicillium crustosum TaxID=36656 RepID=UPI00238251F4|nr:uncharacterized protein N7487_002944 [Penicillium crustosum]KAJ5419394.1 hypothetical protein N7487_002944 [Penicillium crustosum]
MQQFSTSSMVCAPNTDGERCGGTALDTVHGSENHLWAHDGANEYHGVSELVVTDEDGAERAFETGGFSTVNYGGDERVENNPKLGQET